MELSVFVWTGPLPEVTAYRLLVAEAAEAAEAGSAISLVRSFLGSGKCLDMADSSSRTLLALCSGGGAGAGPGVGVAGAGGLLALDPAGEAESSLSPWLAVSTGACNTAGYILGCPLELSTKVREAFT